MTLRISYGACMTTDSLKVMSILLIQHFYTFGLKSVSLK